MSGRVSAEEDGLHSEHDSTGFNKASGQNQRGRVSETSEQLKGPSLDFCFSSLHR